MNRISAVIPTYNRAAALRQTLPDMLAIDAIDELIFVNDGGTDDTDELLQATGDSRLRVVRHARNRGSQEARMTGIRRARGEWILLLEDDCTFPSDYATTLLREALETEADIVGAPWFHSPTVPLAQLMSEAASRSTTVLDLGSHPSTMPSRAVETPWLPAPVLASRRVFDVVAYDPRYRGNAWREETSLFLDATQAGFRCLLTPKTASYQRDQWEGGQRRHRLGYEYWIAVNNFYFLRKHGHWLRRQGYISSTIGAQTRFLASRWTRLLVDSFGARVFR